MTDPAPDGVQYPPPDGHPRLFTYHAPADAYGYVLAEAQRRGLSRNGAITQIIREHQQAAIRREARRRRK
jgi:hypothetical protein